MRALLACGCLLLAVVHWAAATVSMQWQQFPPNGPSPSPRAYVSGTFDPVSNRYFVYGGGAGPAGVSSSFNDLWTFDLSSGQWSVYATSGATLIPKRYGCLFGAASYINQYLYLFGGEDYTTMYGDVWTVSSVTSSLTQIDPGVRPVIRRQHALFSRNASTFLIFGGQSPSAFLNDMWEFVADSNNVLLGYWQQYAPQTALVPPPMSQMQAVYDSVRDRLWVWHGMYATFDSSDPSTAMWTYSFASSTWTLNSMTSLTPAIGACSWIYNDALYMFGGHSNQSGLMNNQTLRLSLSSSTPYTFNALALTADSFTVEPRSFHHCQLVPSLSAYGIASAGVLIFGGQTYSGPTNELLFIDLINQKWLQLRPNQAFPTPRAFHSLGLIFGQFWMFGGQDAYGNVLDDTWTAQFNADSSSLSWSQVLDSSPQRPVARSMHGTAVALGQMIVFGGRSSLSSSASSILNDLWVYRPRISSWISITSSNSSAIPSGRYAFAFDFLTSSQTIFMFGGVTRLGHSDELWSLNPSTLVWTQINKPFRGALWPTIRAFHASCTVDQTVTSDMMTVIQNYIATASSFASQLLAQQPSSNFPVSLDALNSARTDFGINVNNSITTSIQRLTALFTGSPVSYWLIHGGASDAQGGMSLNDIWIFDPISQFWHVPGNFSATSDKSAPNGRRSHQARALGPLLVVHGGRDDITLLGAAPAYLPLGVNGIVSYSYPFSAFPLDSSKLLGTPQSATDGGTPPMRQLLTPSQLLSMSPVVISALGSWSYVDQPLISYYVNVANTAVTSFPANTSWSTIGMLAGHKSVRYGGNIFYSGGFSSINPSSSSPVASVSATSMRVYRSSLSPICNTVVSTTALSSFPSGWRQSVNGAESCFLCPPGSYVVPGSTKASCGLCPTGSYANLNGMANCTLCQPGFFSTAISAITSAACSPCPYGYYNPTSGQSVCLECTSTSYCPPGSVYPSTSFKSAASTESQPAALADNSSFIASVQYIVMAAGAGTLIFVSAISICALKCNCGHFEILDLFSRQHQVFTRPRPRVKSDNELWKEFYIDSWQTQIGGICSILFLVAAVTITLLLVLPFKYDPIAETRSLIPNLAVDPVRRAGIRSNIVLTLRLSTYGGMCGNSVGVCNSGISRSISPMLSISPDSGLDSMTCTLANATCIVTYSCTSCSINQDSSSFIFQFSESSSSSSQIDWSLSFSTGIQLVDVQNYTQTVVPGGQLSTLTGQIMPPTGQVFRGITPTVLSVVATNSIFDSIVTASGSGILATLFSQTAGSSLTASNFELGTGMAISLSLTRQSTAMTTKQTAKLAIAQTLASLAGAISALMGAVGVILLVIEQIFMRPRGWGVASSNKLNFDALRGSKGSRKTEKLQSLESHTSAGDINASSSSNRFDSKFVDNSSSYEPLPKSFGGSRDLVMPPYLPNSSSGTTLPSRLDVLGNQDFKFLSVVTSFEVGNSIVGFNYNFSLWISKLWRTCWGRKPNPRNEKQLFLLPSVLTRSMAKVTLALRILFLGIVTMLIVYLSSTTSTNVGRAWMVGLACSLFVLLRLGMRRASPDGVIPFCRSMGVPEVEEYMFSYSWKVEEESIRTLAKACWNTGVGVWIDVVKLCAGDEIRPVVRTMVRSVYRCVVFMSPEYASSPNCCVEFWEAVQYPEKLVICTLKSPAGLKLPIDIKRYLNELEKRGSVLCNGIEELIPILNDEIEDSTDFDAFQWWQSKEIAGGGVPDHVVPTDFWPIPLFQVFGTIFTPKRSISVGPAYLAGDCSSQGIQMKLPWLLIFAFAGLLINVGDMYIMYSFENNQHNIIDFVWLAFIGMVNISTFFSPEFLVETRNQCDSSLRPLLASRAIMRGVRIRIVGDKKHPLAATVQEFLESIDHDVSEKDQEMEADYQAAVDMRGEEACMLDSELASMRASIRMRVSVFIISTMEERDTLFGSENFPFNAKTSMFIWVGTQADGSFLNPFTRDHIGVRMMRFLVLVADWEKENLAESLFSAIGMRVVEVLHNQSSSVDSVRKMSKRGSIRFEPPSSPELKALLRQDSSSKSLKQDSLIVKPSAFVDHRSSYEPLPDQFGGSVGLEMPPYLGDRASGITVPSRLDVLGQQSLPIFAALFPKHLGNSVIGFDFQIWNWITTNIFCQNGSSHTTSARAIVVLPLILSKAVARMTVFLRLLLSLILILIILTFSNAASINVGKVWIIGSVISGIVLIVISQRRPKPDGVIPFCRSMGVPEVEEYMFSYSWKVEEESIRTLAKACWNTGVGVWIDVVKLCAGDEIRPVVRTMVRSVYRCVVFMSPEYASSPNCCVEFWEAVQYPEKLTICILDSPAGLVLSPEIHSYCQMLQLRGAVMCHGLRELIPLLNSQIEDSSDAAAYRWWQGCKIASGGVPAHIVPTSSWTIPKFAMTGRVFIPSRSIACGPSFLAGNCESFGRQTKWPWLFIMACVGLAINLGDTFAQFQKKDESWLDIIWLVLILLTNSVVFVTGFHQLFETRTQCDAALRPLIASRAILGGVQVAIEGEDSIAQTLRGFLRSVQHLARPSAPTDATQALGPLARQLTIQGGASEKSLQLKVIVMNSLEHRDQMFGTEGALPFDPMTTFFIWNGRHADGKFLDPFTRDACGQNMMRFLVLVAEWEKENLAESLFSAIGMRVSYVLHSLPAVSDAELHVESSDTDSDSSSDANADAMLDVVVAPEPAEEVGTVPATIAVTAPNSLESFELTVNPLSSESISPPISARVSEQSPRQGLSRVSSLRAIQILSRVQSMKSPPLRK